VVAAFGPGPPAAALVTATTASTAHPAAAAAGSAVVIGGLSSPAAFTVAGDGRIYYAELVGGVVKVWNPTTKHSHSIFTIPNGTGGQTLGMTLRGSFLYLYSVRNLSGVRRLQLSRISVQTASGSGFRVLRDIGTRPVEHSGGPVQFGPDGMLYLSVGDHDDPANAQNRRNDFGKILRMTPNGGVPAGATDRIYAYGIRNSFGFAFDPTTRRLWATENGPECNDEVNLIFQGGNYGWGPTATCSTPPPAPTNTNQDGPSPRAPKTFFGVTIAPTGAVFSGGALLYGTYNTRQIRRITLSAGRTGVVSEAPLLTNPSPVLSMQNGPNGKVYFADMTAIRVLR
jgi:glucose/arabinose dehydrogenase